MNNDTILCFCLHHQVRITNENGDVIFNNKKEMMNHIYNEVGDECKPLYTAKAIKMRGKYTYAQVKELFTYSDHYKRRLKNKKPKCHVDKYNRLLCQAWVKHGIT